MANIKHRLTGTIEYEAWRQMIYRCTDPNHIQYKNYGARGITVCDEWLQDPTPFVNHIGPRPSIHYSVDRIKNDKGYEPGNVHWATRNEQALNRRTSKGSPGVKIYKATGLWGVITPVHPKTKKFIWLGRKFESEESGAQAREDWLKANWPEYPKGSPITEW